MSLNTDTFAPQASAVRTGPGIMLRETAHFVNNAELTVSYCLYRALSRAVCRVSAISVMGDGEVAMSGMVGTR